MDSYAGFAPRPDDSDLSDDETTSLLGAQIGEEGGSPLDGPLNPGDLLFGDDNEQIKSGGVPMDSKLVHDYGYKLLDEALHEVSGKFQYFLAFICAMANFVDAAEVMMMGLLYPVLQKDFNLTEGQLAIVPALTNAGMLLGAVGFGKLSDKYGRRLCLLISMFLCSFFGFISSWANDIYSFSVIRLFLGLGYGGNLVTATTLLVEFVSHEKRGVAVILTTVGFGIGAVSIAGISWAVIPQIGWRWLLRIAALMALPTLVLLLFVPESPRYYILRKKYDKCVQSMEYVARFNGKTLPSAFNANTLAAVHHEQRDELSWRNCWGTKLLCRTAILRTLVPLAACWFLNNFAFTIVNWIPIHAESSFPDTDGIVYSVALVQSSGLLLGNISQLILVSYVSRLSQLRFGFALTALTVLILGLVGLSSLVSLYILAFLLNYVEQFVIGTLYVYTPEAFPTALRASAFGMCQSLHRFAPIVSPFVVASLDSIGFNVTCFVYAALFFVGFLCSLTLHLRTFNKPLMEESDIIEQEPDTKIKGTLPEEERGSLSFGESSAPVTPLTT